LRPTGVTWSANLEDIHRLAAGSFDGTFAAFENDIHPDDRAGVVAASRSRCAATSRTARSIACRHSRTATTLDRTCPPSCSRTDASADGRTCRDVTERSRCHRELRARVSHQEAIRARRARADRERPARNSSTRRGDDRQDLRRRAGKILEVVPAMQLLLRSGVRLERGMVGNAYVSTAARPRPRFTLASGGP